MTKTTKDPRQIDLEDWLMLDEYTTPAPEETKNALHKILERNQMTKIIFALGNDPKDCIPNEPQFMKDTHASHRAQRLLMLARGQHIVRKLEQENDND